MRSGATLGTATYNERVSDSSIQSPTASRADARRTPRARARVSVVGVIGELLITAGVVVMLFLGWYVWLNDIITGSAQQDAAQEIQEQLRADFERDRGSAEPEPEPVDPETPRDPGEPVVGIAPPEGEAFGALIVPRFGENYVRTIASGVDLQTVLNNSRLGVGHYMETQMPGEVGNFALAAHRTTYGAPFADIAELRAGDNIYVETREGWYEYSFRNLEYVWPTAVQVLEPVPQAPQVEASDRILTLTSCNPRFSAAERIIAYAVFETWYPREDGPPAEISGLTEAAAGSSAAVIG
ncbi:sortase A [Microcella putealis]|uniref:Sortase A n=1 Tax=Microcella putealis TaxID=337005 RepID=A0A4Q7LPE1_9MICO|nr:sortase A [Microcella putealis]TQM27262.1 sortase A [Microcella putealis]